MKRARVVNVLHETYDVYIGRPGPWGNPFKIDAEHNRATVIHSYRRWLAQHPEVVRRAKRELRGKRLGCYCAPLACHGDILIAAMEETT